MLWFSRVMWGSWLGGWHTPRCQGALINWAHTHTHQPTCQSACLHWHIEWTLKLSSVVKKKKKKSCGQLYLCVPQKAPLILLGQFGRYNQTLFSLWSWVWVFSFCFLRQSATFGCYAPPFMAWLHFPVMPPRPRRKAPSEPGHTRTMRRSRSTPAVAGRVQ